MAADTVVVVPTYNERENIVPLVQAIEASGVDCDVLVVDDNSPDGTGQLVDELGRTHPRVSALHRPGRGGLGSAYVEGFRLALGRGYRLLSTGGGSSYGGSIPRTSEIRR